MRYVTGRYGRRKSNPFDICAKRRREIVLHARLVGAADSEDFSRWLIAWVWHNAKAIDPIWAVMEAAKRMDGKITEAEASAIIEEAATTRKHLSADNLARWLGITYDQRQKLRLTTIGSTNVKKADRKEIRRVRDKVKRRQKRRAAGVRPRSEYEANSLSRSQPWRTMGMSRAAWYRRKNKTATRSETSVSAAIFLSTEDRPVSTGLAEGSSTLRKESKELPSSQTAYMPAVDRYQSLPVELRLLALGLPLPEEMRMVA